MTSRDVAPAGRVILGSGRSGTTWVLDCLAQANALRPIFEPLHPDQSSIGRLHAYAALGPDDSNESLQSYCHRLAAGHIRSQWIDYRAPRNVFRPDITRMLQPQYVRRWIYRWRKYLRERVSLAEMTRRDVTLIKCIRANLMAGWLARTVNLRTALIVRHPCAAVESQRRLRYGAIWDPLPVLARYRADRRLHELTDGRYARLLARDLSSLQALTLNWVIENQWPVERGAADGYCVVHYEDLAANPDSAWRHLCDALDLAVVPDASIRQRPSHQATVGVSSSSGDTQWRRNLSRGDLDIIQEVLDETGCRLYRVDDVSPQVQRHGAATS